MNRLEQGHSHGKQLVSRAALENSKTKPHLTTTEKKAHLIIKGSTPNKVPIEV